MYISLSLSILLSLLALFINKNKFVSLLFCLFMWLLFGWNYMNGDYEAYETYYNTSLYLIGSDSIIYEVGYKYLMIISNLVGLSFQNFYITISLIIILLFYRFFIRFSEIPGLFLFSYFWFFFPADYVFLRNTLAFVIVLQGFYCVFFNTNHKYLKYFLFVTIAVTIHSSSLFYYLMYLAFIPKRLSIFKTLLFVILGVILFNFLYSHFKTLFFSFNQGDRFDIYYSSLGVFVVNSIFQIMNVFFIYIFYSAKKNKNNNNIDIMIYNINVVLLFLIIFYFSLGIFVRIFRYIAIINIAYMLNLLFSYKSYKRDNIIQYFTFFIVYLFSFLRFIIPYWDNTIHSLFRYNLIFN